MKTLTLFNHKGGVGKTTLTVNLADAFADAGETVLLVDTDPQCNLSAFYLVEEDLDKVLLETSKESKTVEDEEAEEENAQTIWASLKPVALGRGGIRVQQPEQINKNIYLLVGDVLLSQFEEELPTAWTESFARKPRGYDVMCALSRLARETAKKIGATLVMYDVGPNVGPLNRTVLLDSDFFITPVHTDLYSLRALTTVGRSLSKWIRDWGTVKQLASSREKERLIHGSPKYLGYIASAYQTYGGRKAKPHEYWERMIPARVKSRVSDLLRTRNGPEFVTAPPWKLGDVPDFHSLAASSQEFGLAVGKLRGHVDSGHYERVDQYLNTFRQIAKTISKRMEE
jgi:cellulose biosynthesis protein BcsQ